MLAIPGGPAVGMEVRHVGAPQRTRSRGHCAGARWYFASADISASFLNIEPLIGGIAIIARRGVGRSFPQDLLGDTGCPHGK